MVLKKEGKLNCKGEGPPGPIWCRQCGHDPKCCTCEEWEPTSAPDPEDPAPSVTFDFRVTTSDTPPPTNFLQETPGAPDQVHYIEGDDERTYGDETDGEPDPDLQAW